MQILVFVSANCPHCPNAERVAKKVAQDYVDNEVSYEKVRTNTPRGKELSIFYHVMGTPTILFLDDEDNELKRIVGTPSEENLRKKIEKLLGLRKSFLTKLFNKENNEKSN